MATIDVGKLSFTHKGDYSSSTAYVLNDVVYYNGSAYIAKQSTTNNVPTNTTYWSTLAAGSGGIWDSTLSLGTAGKILQVNSGATALEFTDKPVGGVLQVKNDVITSYFSISGTTQQVIWTGDTLTLASTSSKVWLKGDFGLGGQSGGSMRLEYSSDGGSNWSTISNFADIGDTDSNQNDGTAILGWHFNPSGSLANYTVLQQGFSYLHSPSSTSAKYRLKASPSSTGYTFTINRRYEDTAWRTLSFMTTMEVGV